MKENLTAQIEYILKMSISTKNKAEAGPKPWETSESWSFWARFDLVPIPTPLKQKVFSTVEKNFDGIILEQKGLYRLSVN